jgi:predicted negative regulator of RcsB-dependent stress response
VDVYSSEQEQIEALKKWWKDNGTAVIAGLAIGCGGLFGWQYWQGQRIAEAEAVSKGFQQLMSLIVDERHDDARYTGERIMAQFADNGYAVLTAFTLARLAVENDDPDTAMTHLQWVLDHTDRAEFEHLARLRLARLRLARGELDAAWALTEEGAGGDKASLHELKGDILLARGDLAAARKEYQRGIALLEAVQGDSALLELKLDDLGIGAEATDR